ncbi:MAG: type II toxin-antitoxin system VapC family toxin, partial [Gemmatimonadota bacterium]
STAVDGLVVLDSSFLVAYYNARDAHHAAAARAMVQLLAGVWGRALLLEYVFLEVVTVLLARRGLGTALTVGETLLAAREVEFVSCSDLFVDAWVVFREQAAGGLSLADAAIVWAARREAPGHVLTFDEDFRDVEGVTVLPS